MDARVYATLARSSASELAAAAKDAGFRTGDSVVLRAETGNGSLAADEAVAHARALLAGAGVTMTVQVRRCPLCHQRAPASLRRLLSSAVPIDDRRLGMCCNVLQRVATCCNMPH